MTSPAVVELPRRLEPVSRDTFIDALTLRAAPHLERRQDVGDVLLHVLSSSSSTSRWRGVSDAIGGSPAGCGALAANSPTR
jgi:hypothetical protein